MKNSKLIYLFLALVIGLYSCGKDDPVSSGKSSEKKITSFVFATLTPPAVGVINESAKTITVSVPAGTDVTKLVPVVNVSDKATISPSGGLAQNFSAPVIYSVTAEDGSVAKYTVTVNVGGASATTQTIKGTIKEDLKLKDLGLPIDYIIEGDVYIDDNVTLTIEPGVTVQFKSTGSSIVIQDNAGIMAKGTADNHIKFIGSSADKGSFYALEVRSNRASNLIEYVDFINGGSNDSYGVVYISGGAKLNMKNCLIDGSLGYGLYCASDGKLLQFTGNTIKNCEKEPVYASILAGVIVIDASNKLDNNKKNQILISGSAGIKDEATLNNVNIPWYFEGGYYAENTFTVQPGTTLIFDLKNAFYCQDNATIVAKGTAERPITFKGGKSNAGYWDGINIKSGLDNIMEYCVIDGGGSSESWACVYVDSDAKITLNNNQFSNSGSYGISRYKKDNTKVKGTGNTFTNCALGNVENRSESEDADKISTNL